MDTSTPKQGVPKRKIIHVQSPENSPAKIKGKLSETAVVHNLLEDSTDTTFLGFTNDSVENTKYSNTSSDPDIDDNEFLDSFENSVQLSRDKSSVESVKSIENTIRYIEDNYNSHISDANTVVNKNQHVPSNTVVKQDLHVPSNIQAELLSLFDNNKFKEVISDSVNTAIETKIQPIEQRLTNVESASHVLGSRIDDLEYAIDNVDQTTRLNRLVISGYPENESENILDKFLDLAQFLKIPLIKQDVLSIKRLGRRNPDSTKPRIILVELINKAAKEDLYRNRGMLKSYKYKSIFLNEDLTPSKSRLFYEVRKRAKILNHNSCFTRNGWIYVKKTKDSFPLRIANLTEIDQKLPMTSNDFQ